MARPFYRVKCSRCGRKDTRRLLLPPEWTELQPARDAIRERVGIGVNVNGWVPTVWETEIITSPVLCPKCRAEVCVWFAPEHPE